MPKPTLLLILDGWGHRKETEFNAIALANTPHYDQLMAECPHALLDASGESVGLPAGQMGNSEVGHLHIGAGRQVPQSLLLINQVIAKNKLNENQAIINTVKQSQHTVHIIGLLSPGGVHSHEEHLHALIATAAYHGAKTIAIHAILDGRDTPPQSAQASITKLEQQLKTLGVGHIASICGRYYAMDRDQRWDRTQKAYALYVDGVAARQADSASAALTLAYHDDETDEFVRPTLITNTTIKDGDTVIFANFRADRMRQLVKALTQPDLTTFDRPTLPKLARACTMTSYQDGLSVDVAFPKVPLKKALGECLSEAGLAQWRITETEKFAHVTYFLNGGSEAIASHEQRILIPSDQVATYDLAPAMQCDAITDAIIAVFDKHDDPVIISNFANADMVGHTGNLEATIAAIEAIDHCLGRLLEALRRHDGQMILTADHGNAEQLFDPKQGQPHTAHTNNPVPMIFVGSDTPTKCQTKGALTDIAPTMLTCLGLPIPKEMSGRTLLQWDQNP